ncbi:helix-turn-helix transcriptional regulator [Leptolyngbya sp. FACHB-541]|uniref:AraC family transcriptional regulator n=1 Tax=Leptolyngbya sp. FACHB-541 TaxID=2692810 RepID=UPI001683020A|nr:AraC family transcriptional regulator [Leptolyngbya sp. FACHB-541]MBD2000600.1 helix-turn-helix transcriptional regulator [Leptolyngbya sp. FACHB-541]
MTSVNGLPLVDLTKQARPALSESPVISSQRSQWQGIFFNHYDHPAHESPEFQYMQHVIGITGSGHPISSEHRFEGQVQTCYCQPGEVLFIPAKVRYSSIWQQPGEFSLIGFLPAFFEKIVNESIQPDRIELIPKIGLVDPFIQQVGLALKADVEADHPAGRMFGESLATGLAIHLIKHYSTWQMKLPLRASGYLSKSQLQKVTDYIQTHLDQDISLADMAGILGLSQYHFCRLFKQSTGRTPHQYLTQCRIDRAKQFLSKPELTITEIAFEVGFTNHSSFTRLFRQCVGVTPKMFRESR